MPYCAPFAAIPKISIAPRFAETKASPVTHAGRARPERKKSSLVAIARLARRPMVITNAK
jgi:hypothetical protein